MSSDSTLKQDPYRLRGEMLDHRYRLVDFVAAGGFGVVYKATDERLGKTVAVKVIKPDLKDNVDACELFQREVELVASLNNRHIVTVTDVGQHQGSVYVVTEWLEGRTLEEELRLVGQFSLGETENILAEMTRAFEAAHQKGIVHRDIKPSNIHLGPADATFVKVLDFGLAKAIDSTSAAQISRVAGTVAYMSPEQFDRGGQIDSRSDIYSLGVVLFRMLSGRLPFIGPEPVVMKQHLSESPPRLVDVRPEVGETVSGVIHRALSKIPADRFETVRELCEAFREALRASRTSNETVPDSSTLIHPLGRSTPSIESNPVWVPTDDPRFAEWFRHQVTRISNCETDEVIADCDRLLSLNKDPIPLLAVRGWAYAVKNEFDKALVDINEALRLSSENWAIYLIRASIYIETGQHDDALRDLIKITSEEETVGAEIYFHRGNLYSRLRRFDEAASDFTKAIRLQPDNEVAYLNRGVCHREKNENEKAIADWSKALSVNPNYMVAYRYRAFVYEEQKDYQRALADYTEILRLDTASADAYGYRGDLHLKMGQHVDAITDFQKVLDLSPTSAEAYYNCGVAYFGAAQYEEAIAYFIQATRLKPDHAMAHGTRGMAYYFQNKHEKAIEALSKCLSIDPNKTWALEFRGFSYFALDEPDEAMADAIQVLRLDSTNLKAVSLRGRIRLNNNQYDKAIDDFTKCLASKPDAQLYRLRGIAYYEKGEFRSAIGDMSEAILMDPASTEVLFLRGVMHSQVEDFHRAIADFDTLLRWKPDFAAAYHSRALAYSKLGKTELAEKDFQRYKDLEGRS